MSDPTSVSEIARAGIITEQNAIIAAAYGALQTASQAMERAYGLTAMPSRDEISNVQAAINLIENWKQKREG
jgi:hypothetical protein